MNDYWIDILLKILSVILSIICLAGVMVFVVFWLAALGWI